MSYRPDIEGLRAVAVSVIVLFHMGLSSLSGGYVGVDVFFVISGFLITGILARELKPGPVGLATAPIRYSAFYWRRVRRLAPAMIVTLLGTLAAGYALVPPDYYEGLGESSVAALLSVSNILFWAQSGYFDADAILKPLLHTWSLGVEEQFYLVWPVTLGLVMTRYGLRQTMVAMAAISFLTLIAAEVLLSRHPSAVFYLMPFRVSEFALGAVLALSGSRLRQGLVSHVASLGGLALILGASFVYNKETRFPGLATLVPSMGTALLIWSAGSGAGNRLLTLAPVRYIGRISYSLYLVHWPLVSLYAFRAGAPDGWGEIAGLTASAVILGALMYHVVETPFRRTAGDGSFRVPLHMLRNVCAAGALTVVAVGADIGIRDGYQWRMPAEITLMLTQVSESATERRRAIRQKTCHFSSANPDYFGQFESCLPATIDNAVVVLGDSHAADIYAGLHRILPDGPVVQLTAAGCALSRLDPAERCDVFFDHARTWLLRNRDRIAMVIYSQRAASAMFRDQADIPTAPDPAAVERLANEIAALSREGIRIVVWGPRPEFHPRIDVVLGRSSDLKDFRQRMAAIDTSPYRALDADLEARMKASGIQYLSMIDVLCTAEGCRYLDESGAPLIVDYGHWAPDAAPSVMRRMIDANPELRQALGPS